MMQFPARSEVGRVETTHIEGAPQIRLVGECDMYTAPAVEQHLQAMVDRGLTRIIFDLEYVTFLDSTILRIFLDARRAMSPNGGEVILLCRPGFVRRLLGLLEMDRLLRICTPEEWRRQTAAVN
jgi:anti-sigma B factor antagonist